MTLAIVPDDFSPITVGDTLNPLSLQFWTRDTNGNAIALNLSGLTISMKMQEKEGAIKTCANAWIIDNAASGLAHYPYASSDTDTVGTWTLYIALTNGLGQTAHTVTKILQINAAP